STRTPRCSPVVTRTPPPTSTTTTTDSPPASSAVTPAHQGKGHDRPVRLRGVEPPGHRTMTWPAQPLLDLPGVSNRDVAKALRASGSGWHRMCANGLNDWQADRAAIRLGTLPHLVWAE